jgi:hypothetical protein
MKLPAPAASALAWLNAAARRYTPKAITFTRRWSVFFILLPSQVFLAIAGSALFAHLDPRIAVDNPFAFLAELPALASYASCAIAFAVFFKMLLWHDLPREAEAVLQKQAAEGNAGARWILIKDRLEWTVLLIVFIAFFWPSR